MLDCSGKISLIFSHKIREKKTLIFCSAVKHAYKNSKKNIENVGQNVKKLTNMKKSVKFEKWMEFEVQNSENNLQNSDTSLNNRKGNVKKTHTHKFGKKNAQRF